MKYRKKPIPLEASQWFKPGDHPAVIDGKFVVTQTGTATCGKCGKQMSKHGWCPTLEGGHIACPGDWIITGVKGENYPCKPDIFAETYEPVPE